MKSLTILTGLIVLLSLSTLAQKKTAVKSDNYRRSSLYTILAEGKSFEMQNLVEEAYQAAPFPEKYNNHCLASRAFQMKPFVKELGLNTKGDKGADSVKDKGSEKALTILLPIYFEREKVAQQLVAKWYGRKEDGTFDSNLSLIVERGAYDANQEMVDLAKMSKRGRSMIDDAAEELISNTFVVVQKMNFFKNEPVAKAVYVTAMVAANQINNSIAQTVAKIAATAIYEATKDGYTVTTTSYLYQLVWNEEIAAIFYEEMWMTDPEDFDSIKKQRFENSKLFQLKYIGEEKARNVVLISAGKGGVEKIVKIATVRNMDRCYTKLQKKYDEFKTKTPLYSVEPLMAKIGMKEGVTKGDKFEVLEFVIDKEGKSSYKTVGVIKADKPIWDNRYSLGVTESEKEAYKEKVQEKQRDLAAVQDAEEGGKKEKKKKDKKKSKEDKGEVSTVEGTTFKGKVKGYAPGMLLRQIK